MEDQSAAQQIDAIIKKHEDWRGEMVSRLRAVIKQADPAVVEEVKCKKPSRGVRQERARPRIPPVFPAGSQSLRIEALPGIVTPIGRGRCNPPPGVCK